MIMMGNDLRRRVTDGNRMMGNDSRSVHHRRVQQRSCNVNATGCWGSRSDGQDAGNSELIESISKCIQYYYN